MENIMKMIESISYEKILLLVIFAIFSKSLLVGYKLALYDYKKGTKNFEFKKFIFKTRKDIKSLIITLIIYVMLKIGFGDFDAYLQAAYYAVAYSQISIYINMASKYLTNSQIEKRVVTDTGEVKYTENSTNIPLDTQGDVKYEQFY